MENFDQFFEDLKKSESQGKKDKTQRSNDENRIHKIYSRFKGHQGTIYGVPFTTKTGSPLVALEGVRTSKLDIDGKRYSIKLLPKEHLAIVPGSAEDRLYNEIVSLHSNLMDLKGTNFSLAKKEYVYLMYMYVLRHYDSSMALVTESENKPSLLVMSNVGFKTAFLSSTETYTQLLGSTSWTNRFYTRDEERNGIVKIIFQLNGNNYNFSYNYEDISMSHYGMTNGKPTVTVDKAIIETYFDDPINDYLGVDKVEERFNLEWYQKVKEAMLAELDKINKGGEV